MNELPQEPQSNIGAVSSSNLMNMLDDDYELNKQFHVVLRDCIYCFCVAHYNETMTFENWLATYYR